MLVHICPEVGPLAGGSSKSIEKDLWKSERTFARFMDGLAVAVLVVSADGKPYYANSLADQLFAKRIAEREAETRVGRSPEALGAYLVGTELAYPSDRWPLARALAGESVTTDDIEIRRPDKIIRLGVSAAPIFDERGGVEYAVATFTDITERKRMEKETRALNEIIVQRLAQKINEIDNISRVRDMVRKSPDVSTGLDLILENALQDLGMDVGAVMLVDSEKNAVKVRGFKSKVEGVGLRESYPLNAELAELEAVNKCKNVSEIVGQGEQSILTTRSIHCAPISFGKELYGIFALGSRKDRILDSSDLATLSLYSGLASTLFETQSLTVTPVKEVPKGVKRRFELEFGCVYLVKDDVERAFEVFVDNVLSGVEGLCITREFPPKIRRRYGLERTPIVWLTEERLRDQQTVNALQDLSIMIDSFLKKAGRGVVLLDGFEYLITNNGFERFVHFLQLNRSRFEQSNSILVAPILGEALDVKEVKLLEREMKPLKV